MCACVDLWNFKCLLKASGTDISSSESIIVPNPARLSVVATSRGKSLICNAIQTMCYATVTWLIQNNFMHDYRTRMRYQYLQAMRQFRSPKIFFVEHEIGWEGARGGWSGNARRQKRSLPRETAHCLLSKHVSSFRDLFAFSLFARFPSAWFHWRNRES